MERFISKQNIMKIMGRAKKNTTYHENELKEIIFNCAISNGIVCNKLLKEKYGLTRQQIERTLSICKKSDILKRIEVKECGLGPISVYLLQSPVPIIS